MKDFIERSRHERWPVRVVSWLLMVVIAIGATLGMATMAHADDDELDGVMSFYALASSTSSFLGNSLSPDNDNVRDEMWDKITKHPSSGGSVLGYSDKNRNDGANWISSMWTAASHTMSYEAFNVKEEGASSDAPTSANPSDRLNGVIDYTHFGAALSGMGLDKTKTGLGLGFLNFIGGGLILILFTLSYAVDLFFSAVVSVLSMLNPFRLFYPAVAAINPTFAEGMVGGDTSDLPSGLAGLASFISSWYSVLENMAWTVMVPIFLAVMVMSLVLFKNLNKGSTIKKFVVRLVFIGLGLPLIGSMYTGVLDSMADATGGKSDGSTRVVVSTFVDFESWVLNNNLGFPDDAIIEWDISRSRPSDRAQMNVRATALAINKNSNWRFYNVGSAFDDSGSWAEQAQGDVGGGSLTSYSAARDLLSRYMGGNMITASDYETKVKGVLTNRLSNTSDGDAKKRVTAWFKGFKDGKKLNDPGHSVEDISLSDNIESNGILRVNPGSGLMAEPSGAGYGVKKFTSSNSGCYPSVTNLSNCNLAPMAMYNYLNTTFGSESYTVYSAQNSTSGATREVHTSVNLVGTGIMSFVYWLNALVLLGSFVAIGLGYAVGMAISNIRRSIQIITAVPFATLGALAGIAKVVVYTFALIIELIITVFLYMMVQEFLISLPQIIEMPFSTFLNTGSGAATGAAVLGGSSVAMIISLISVVVTVIFTIMALRVRKTLVKAVEEAVTKLVNKFMDTSAGAPGGGGQMMPALAGGLAAGAGASAMNRAMGGKQGSPKSNVGGTSGTGAGPAAIGTDAGGGGDTTNNAFSEANDSTLIDADEVGGDGSRGGADGSSSGGGSPVEQSGPGASVSADTATTDKGKEVAANGLSDPMAKPGKGDPTAAAGANQDDAMSSTAASMEDSAQKYKEADQAKVGAATEGAKAVGHGAVAVGAGAAGDAKTATEHGSKAVAAGAEAKARAHESKAKADEAGRSSLDKPSSGKHAQKAQQARAVGQAAGTVGQAAGAANGGKGGSSGGAPKAPAKAPAKTPSTPKPSSGGSGGSRPSPQAPKAPQGGSPQRQQAPRRAPAPRQAPAPAPRQQAPRQAPAPRPQQAPAQSPAPQQPVRQQQAPARRQAPTPKAQGRQKGKPGDGEHQDS